VGILKWFYSQYNHGDKFARNRENGCNYFYCIINGDHFRLIRGGGYSK
jgi:hypothetical protein